MKRVLVIGLVLAASLVALVPNARAQGADPQAVALTAADVPSSLRLSRSGAVTRGGGAGYEVFFEVSDPFRMSGDSVVQVANVVVQQSDPVAGMNDFISASQGVFGSLTEQGPQPVGDEGRAYTSTMNVGPFGGASRAVVVFRRGNIVAGVTVSSTGSQAPLGEAARLAALVDARLGPAPAAAVGGQ